MARWRGVVISAARAIEVGTYIAADRPSIIRETLKAQRWLARAKRNSPPAKATSPQTRSGLRPILSEIRPTTGEAKNCTRAKRADISPMSKAEKWYSVLMKGITGKIRLIPKQIRNSLISIIQIVFLTVFVTMTSPLP